MPRAHSESRAVQGWATTRQARGHVQHIVGTVQHTARKVRLFLPCAHVVAHLYQCRILHCLFRAPQQPARLQAAYTSRLPTAT
jgi:hypothetical protein